MNSEWAIVWIYLGCVLVASVGYIIWLQLSSAEKYGDAARLYEEARPKPAERASKKPKNQKGSSFKELSKLARAADSPDEKMSILEKFQLMVAQSGMAVTPMSVLITCAATSGLMAVMGGVAALYIGGQYFVGIGIGLLAGIIPIMVVHMKRAKRTEKMLEQLPEALDLIVTVMKSGRTVTHAIQEVVANFDDPIATEFGYVIAQQDLGMHPEACLRELSRRTGLVEMKIFALTLIIQRQSGGNFAELFERLSEVVRQRFKINGVVRTLTAEGRMQAITLMALAPALFVVMMFLNENYASTLFQRADLIGYMGLAMLAGAVWIRQIIKVQF